MSAWREALLGMRPRLIAEVWVGTLLLATLAILWLQIPDSHIWQFAFSVIFACGFLIAFFWFYTWVLGRMLKSAEKRKWWLRCTLLAAVIVAWWLLQMPINKLIEHRELYAGYWTSRLSHGLRDLRTYEHLVWIQDWIYFSLKLIMIGFLLPVALAPAGKLRDGARLILSVWSRWWYWLAVLLCGWIAFIVTGKLMHWTVAHGLIREMFSLLLRLGFVFTLDLVLACFVLQVIAVALRRTAASSRN